MKVHIAWPILLALIAVFILSVLLYQQSWIPDYAEAEPLYSTIAEFGRALAETKTDSAVSASSIKTLMMENRFSQIKSYGVVFSDNPETLVTIRVNERFSFDIVLDGTPKWNKK